MQFNEVIGQSGAKLQMQKLVAEGRVPHAMLFCGPSGCGKMAMAMAVASELLHHSRLLDNWGIPDHKAPEHGFGTPARQRRLLQ